VWVDGVDVGGRVHRHVVLPMARDPHLLASCGCHPAAEHTLSANLMIVECNE
jgi:hypothetical protein